MIFFIRDFSRKPARFTLMLFLVFSLFPFPVARAQEVIFEPDARLPVVYLNVAFLSGAADDPQKRSGLSAFTGEMLLRGTQKHTKQELDVALDQIGAQVGIETRVELMVIRGAVLSSHLDQYLALLEEILVSPRFNPQETERLKNETVGALLEGLNDDRSLGSRHFDRLLFGTHPYGLRPAGKTRDVKRFDAAQVKAHYGKIITSDRMIVLGTGDASASRIQDWTKKVAAALPRGEKRPPLTEPSRNDRRRVFLVDKPERTQTQIYVGHEGPSFLDPDYYAWVIGNEVYGGSAFSTRLMQEIRVKRGWTYSTFSFFRFGSKPHSWRSWAFPAAKDTPATTGLMLQMISDLKTKGISQAEFDSARQILINSAGFKFDTPRKRVENALTERTIGLPEGFFRDFGSKISKVSLSEVNDALLRRVAPDRLTLVVLGTAETLKEPLAKALQIPPKDIAVVKYTDE